MKKTFTLLAIITTTCFFAQIPSYIPTDGLVAYYPFIGNANDVSGNGNNGTLQGNITFVADRFGTTNKAINFNLGTDILCTTNSYVNPNPFSISFWFKTNPNSKGEWLISFNNGKCTHGGNWDRAIFINENQFGFYVYNGSENFIKNSGNFKDEKWHHCVVNLDNSGLKIYMDNVLFLTNTINTAQNYTGFWRIGGLSPNDLNNSSLSNYDDFGIWNRALSPEEITNLYYAENSCQTLVINTGVLGFNPPTYKNTVTIYPNPANDHITIDCGNLANVSGWNIKISNTLGQEVFSGKMDTQQYTLPLNTWGGKGVYFVKIYDASNTLMNTKKIILQ